MRLGFVAKSIAHPELKSHDARRWQNSPHLSVSLAYLRDMLLYLAHSRIRMYRMSSELAPYATHPDMPQFRRQVDECAVELAAIGQLARENGIRLSFHPGQHVVLNSPDRGLGAHSAADLIVQASILEAMGSGPEAVVVVHVGGVYEDRRRSLERFVAAYGDLPASVRRRLALENDDTRFGVDDTLWLNGQTGVPLIFDNLHHRLNNPGGRAPHDALAACLATWPSGVTPKIHYSSPRTELNVDPVPGRSIPHIRPPQWRNHADYVNPFEFIDFMRTAQDLPPFDVMLEVKAKDLALLQLRRDLAAHAPDVAEVTDVAEEAPTPADGEA